MINPGNGSKWGIKPSGTNLTVDIHEIIDNANSYIVVCGYNFSPYNHPTSIIPRLIARRNAGVNVLLIAPPRMWGFGNTNHTNNLQHLINNGIGVILNTYNHSKWIISDYGYYYGSLNFTASSMTTKVEVVSFCDSLQQPNIPWWMNRTKQELLQFAVSELNHFNTVTATTNLGIVNTASLNTLQGVFARILRYNPEIEKVERTLLNYEDVRNELSSIIDNYFPLITISELDKIWQPINNAIYTLDKLAYSGNDILLKYQQQSLKGFSIYGYNRIHSNFSRQIERLLVYLKSIELQTSRQEKNSSITKEIENILTGLIDKDNN
jgi:hypothetical protein